MQHFNKSFYTLHSKKLKTCFLVAACPIQVLDQGGFRITSSADCTSLDENGVCTVNTILLYRCPVLNLLGNAVVTCTEDNTWQYNDSSRKLCKFLV